jgi:hypothetical protein
MVSSSGANPGFSTNSERCFSRKPFNSGARSHQIHRVEWYH